MKDMLWRIMLPQPQRIPQIIRDLEAQGWQQRSRIPAVSELMGPDGHILVMVPRSGRVQIRIHYLTAKAQRAGCAQRVHDHVLQLASG